MPNNAFLPSLIPAKGEMFYGLGAHGNVVTGDGVGHIAFDVADSFFPTRQVTSPTVKRFDWRMHLKSAISTDSSFIVVFLVFDRPM